MSPIIPLPMRRRVLVVALAAIVASGAAFAESATVLKATEVRSTPAQAADVLGQLKARDTVEVTGRQGAWSNVTTPGGVAGWARSLNFRGVAAAGGARGSGSADLGALFSTGATGAASTNAAKGFDAEDLMGASPDMARLAQMDAFVSNANDARGFAAQAPLQAQQVAYISSGRGGRRSR